MQSAYRQDVNLIPPEIQEAKHRVTQSKSNTKFAVIIVIFIGIIAAGVFGYNYYLNRQINAIQSDIDAKATTIKDLREFGENGYNLGLRLEVIKDLINDRKNYSGLLEQMNNRTPTQIELQNYTTSSGKDLTLNGVALSNYTPIAEFQDNLLRDQDSDRPYFTHAQINSASFNKDRGSVTFSIKVTLDEESYYDPIK